MKPILIFITTIFMTFSLSAQVKSGVWKGKASQAWFTIVVGPQTKNGVVFEVETRILKARGKLSKDGQILTFKNSDGILQLRRLRSEREFKDAKGYLQFVSVGGTTSFKIEKGDLALPGWDEGVAAVVINHEER